VAIPFSAPRSYTGEDMLELTVHGSPFVVRSLIERCIAAGARPAGPGEFTRRAVANGKLDLVQAEAVRDLVGAETACRPATPRAALRRLSQRLADLRGDLVELLARLEASLDFADHGVELDRADVRPGWPPVASSSRRCWPRPRPATDPRRRSIVIVGPPNCGKSTLSIPCSE